MLLRTQESFAVRLPAEDIKNLKDILNKRITNLTAVRIPFEVHFKNNFEKHSISFMSAPLSACNRPQTTWLFFIQLGMPIHFDFEIWLSHFPTHKMEATVFSETSVPTYATLHPTIPYVYHFDIRLLLFIWRPTAAK
jgi:hypothetical protein